MGEIKYDFKGQVALVTGASSGIGRAVAVGFAKAGAKVVLSDVNDDLGNQSLKLIQGMGAESIYVHCDVSQPDQVRNLVAKTVEKFGQLNLVCNDAGIEGSTASVVELQLENWDRIINTNLKGVWLCMKAQIPEMLKSGGGAIVNVSSIAGLVGFPGLPAYVASKHGVVGLTKTAALEFATSGVRVNAVCPGPILTPMLERLMKSTPGFTDSIVQGVPEKKIGEPNDVAESVLFLCSSQAKYITGQCLAIDGGWVAQ